MIPIASLATFYAAVVAGFLLGVVLKHLQPKVSKAFMYTLLYFLLPLIVFKSLLDEVGLFKEIFLTFALFFIAGVSISFLIALAFFRNLPRLQRCTAVLASTLWNAFFIPIALVIAFGLPEEAILGVIAFTMCYHLFQPFFTIALAVRAHGTYAGDVIVKGLTFPPLRAAIFGLILGSLHVNFNFPAFHELKLATSYLSLVYVGLVLSRAPWPSRGDLRVIVRVGLIRLFIVPIILLPFILKHERPMNVVIAWEVGSPTSVSAVLYAALFGFDDVLMAKIVVYVTFVGILLLPTRLLLFSPRVFAQ